MADAVDIRTARGRGSVPPAAVFVLSTATLPILSLLMARQVADQFLAGSVESSMLGAWEWTAILGLVIVGALLLFVQLAARTSERSSTVLDWFVETGARGGIAAVAVLVSIEAILVAGIILAVETLVFGQAWPGTAAAPLIGGLAASIVLGLTGTRALRRDAEGLQAVLIEEGSEAKLLDAIDALARRFGVSPPDAVLVGLDMAMWSARGTFRIGRRTVYGRVLSLSLPLLAVLPESMAAALMAHEFAHLRAGDTETGERRGRALGRLVEAIRALQMESSGWASLAVLPGIGFLGYLTSSLARQSTVQLVRKEFEADQTAAARVGATVLGDAVSAYELIARNEIEWWDALRQAVQEDSTIPLTRLWRTWRSELSGTEAERGLDSSSINPFLLARRAALGVDPTTAIFVRRATPSALNALSRRPGALVAQVIHAIRPAPEALPEEVINRPRVTQGLLTVLVLGLLAMAPVVLFILGYGLRERVSQLVAVAIFLPGLVTALLYPWWQREVALDANGIRVRSWGRHWLDREDTGSGWIRFDGWERLTLSVGREQTLTVSDGSRRARVRATFWPKSELWRLINGMRARGAAIQFSRSARKLDDERRVVVWLMGERFLVPTVLRTTDGALVEAYPVEVIPLEPRRLSRVLSKRLKTRLATVKRKTRLAREADLAAFMGVEPNEFLVGAHRIAIESYNGASSLRVEGTSFERTWPGRMSPAIATAAIFDARDRVPELPPATERSGAGAAVDAEPAVRDE